MSKTKKQIQQDIAVLENALKNKVGLSPDMEKAYYAGIEKCKKMLAELDQPTANGEPAKALTLQQEENKKANHERVATTKKALTAMASMEGVTVGAIPVYQPTPPPTVRIDWTDRDPEYVTETEAAQKLRNLIKDMADLRAVKDGRVGDVGQRMTTIRAAAYYDAIRALSGADPDAEYLDIMNYPTRRVALNALKAFVDSEREKIK